MTFYFKENLHANFKYKIKKMRVDMKTTSNIYAHFEKCKRAKRLVLEEMKGRFCDDYKKLVGYANALKETNEGTDVVLKFSRNATILKGKTKGQLLSAIGQDSMNHFYPIASDIMDGECKTSWVWFLKQLQKSLNINSGEGITFMSDTPTTIKMYNKFLKIANVCELNFNGNMRALLYKNLDPFVEIHWWYSKEAYLLTYHCKLQLVAGQKFWKIEVEQAMEPLELVNLAGRPRMNRKRDKDEALKRQTEWVAPRRGRKMTCSCCGIPGHNARGFHKFNQNREEGTSNTGQVKSRSKR
ncbi:uncharacterized protein LOC107024828 [Solanum pennellii]|uniref:Uncharacterized protein LOC107024828 n=1 Tax=Solanum pennellii TaxID=28526 RepID=A0ABM1H719_SOLPN|nr:uncharacterized protein LOC107024828 [Solanum pennellii]